MCEKEHLCVINYALKTRFVYIEVVGKISCIDVRLKMYKLSFKSKLKKL